MLFLQSYDISTLFAVKIYKTYGKEAIRSCPKTPTGLAKDIYGIGFFSADKVALSMGYGADSEQRIRAAIEHVLASQPEEGHCYLTTEQIVKQVNELLENQLDDRVRPLLNTMEQAGDIKMRSSRFLQKQQTKDKTEPRHDTVRPATMHLPSTTMRNMSR